MNSSPHSPAEPGERYLSFTYGERNCAIIADQVEEVLGSLTVSRVPGAGRAVRGIAVHRGDILTVLELSELMPAEFPKATSSEKYLVLTPGQDGARLAISISRANGFSDLTSEELGPTGSPPLIVNSQTIAEIAVNAVKT